MPALRFLPPVGRRRSGALLLAGALALTSLTGCGSDTPEGPVVVASVYPLQFIAERIVADDAEVIALTSPGAEPHDLDLTPRQVGTLHDADVVLYEQGLQPALDAALDNEAPNRSVDAAEVLAATEGFDAQDPHFWLDPTLLAGVADAFAAQIAAADPDHAEDYTERNDALQADLADLDAEFQQGLARCRIRTVIVSHDAFGYLARRYDLSVEPIAGLSPDAEPTARRRGELREVAQREGVTTIFSEPLADTSLAESLASDLDLSVEQLDPLEGLVSEDLEASYLTLMRENLRMLRTANGCS